MRSRFIVFCAGVALLLGLVYVYTSPGLGNLQVVFAAGLLGLYVVTMFRNPGGGLLVIAATQPFLGVLRRILYQQSPVSFDVLLLVGPAFCLIMVLTISIEYRQQLTELVRESLTTRLLLWLMFVFTLEMANPLQGSLVVGVAGGLFYLVPVSWFLVGRIFLTDEIFRKILVVFVACGVIGACYGLYQTLVGFPPWDQFWITQVRNAGLYNALGTGGGTIRPLGPATSAAEYASFLAAALVCLTALALFRWKVLLLIPAGLVASALFLEASRSFVLLSAATLVVLLALRQRNRAAATTVLIVVGLVGALTFLNLGDIIYTAGSTSSAAVGNLLEHQINGLAHPFDNRYSTGQLHLQAIISAFRAVLTNPLGFGLGASTMSAAKFGGAGISAEIDIPNVFVSGGLLGGLLYVAILYRTFRAGLIIAFRYKRITDVLPVAVLAVMFTQILNGGYYSLMPFVWMFVAWIDRRSVEVFGPRLPAKSRRAVVNLPLLQEPVRGQ